jgi:hypothetical protein
MWRCTIEGYVGFEECMWIRRVWYDEARRETFESLIDAVLAHD